MELQALSGNCSIGEVIQFLILWNVFRQAIQDATEIYAVGYSLPKTDLTMSLFLAAATATGGKERTVYVVNSASGPDAEELLENYKQTFEGCDMDKQYLGRPDSVQQMVADLRNSKMDC